MDEGAVFRVLLDVDERLFAEKRPWAYARPGVQIHGRSPAVDEKRTRRRRATPLCVIKSATSQAQLRC